MQARPYRKIAVAHEGFVATVTLNVPERKNPLGPEMVNELLFALDDAESDDDVRVLVLTGAGKAFSAGADLKNMARGDEEPASLPPRGDYADLLLRLVRFTKPTIARVPGVAVGGGLGLVAACHFAIAAESATLGTPEVKRGLWPMMIMAVLSRVVPRRALLRMMLLGETLSARDAMEIGLLSKVVDDDALDAEVEARASTLSLRSPTAIRHGLRAFAAQELVSLDLALPALKAALVDLLGTEDAREGLAAFIEKREPSWTGR